MNDAPPFTPVNGRILVKALPYKPSKVVEIFSHDRADETESIVVALSPFKYGRKYDKKKGWEHNGLTFPHDVQVGDRVIHPGTYQDSDTMTLNGVRYRCLDPWEIVGIIHAEQPEGFDHPVTGEKLPEIHPILTH